MSETLRIQPLDPASVEPAFQAVFEGQRKKWGSPLVNHLLYARRPSIYRGVRAMWSGLDASGLIDGKLQALLNRRVASLNGCAF
jgi:hypothetical protein